MLGKRIVIIGGTGGMGLSAARAFVRAGAQVVVTGKEAEQADAAFRLLETDSQNSLTNAGSGENGPAGDLPFRILVSDATEAGSADAAIQLCRQAFGTLTGLYHVAGGSGRKWGDGPLAQMTLEAWQKTLSLNLDAMMLSNRAALQAFLSDGQGGSILNMGSVLGFSPAPLHFATHAYATAKAAIIGMSQSLAAYYAPDDIRVNVVAPAVIETPMAQRALHQPDILQYLHHKQPLAGGGAGSPADVDGVAMLLLSDAGRYITGQVIAVDGGWTVSEPGE